MSLLHARSRTVFWCVLAVALALSRLVRADVQVEGEAHSVSVEARDASIPEVLDALSTRLGLRIRASTVFEWTISGTYRGSLQQVLARLLAGRDYVAKYSEGNVEIMILDSGRDGATAVGLSGAPKLPLNPVGGGYRTSLTNMRRASPQ